MTWKYTNFWIKWSSSATVGSISPISLSQFIREFKCNTYKYGGAIYGFNDRVSDNKCTFQVIWVAIFHEISSPLLSFQDNIAVYTSVSASSVYECQANAAYIKPKTTSHLMTLFCSLNWHNLYNNTRIVCSIPASGLYHVSKRCRIATQLQNHLSY